MHQRKLVPFFFALLLTGGCGSDSTNSGSNHQDLAERLLGHWELVSALRDGRRTETLNGTFFTFLDSQTLVTNIGGMREEMPYELHDGSFLPHGKRFQSEMFVEEIGDSTLTLKMLIRNVEFRMLFKKRPPLNEAGDSLQ